VTHILRLSLALAMAIIIMLSIGMSIALANNPYDPARQRYRPLIGGIQIEIVWFWWDIPISNGYCTIGYMARDGNGNIGIVTAGHCTDFGTGYVVYQPSYDTEGSNRIGSPTIVDIYSDAAFIPYNNVSPSILYITRYTTGYRGIVIPVNAIISWDTIKFYVSVSSPLFYKTGRTTGTTSGYLVRVYEWYNNNITGFTHYRVILTSIYVDHGDSGAPLYHYICGRDGSCWLGLAGHLSFRRLDENGNFLYSGFIHVSSVAQRLGVTPVTTSGSVY